jgi:hypothetical protein
LVQLFQEVHQVQAFQILLLVLVLLGIPLVLFLQDILELPACLHCPSFQVDLEDQLHHLFLPFHLYQQVQASLGILLNQEVQWVHGLRKDLMVQQLLMVQEFHLYQGHLLDLELQELQGFLLDLVLP